MSFLDYVPASKKSKALADLFGDTFCDMDSSQAVRTSRELAGVEVAKYKDSASLVLGGNVLEWWKVTRLSYLSWQTLPKHTFAFLVQVYLLSVFLALQGTLSVQNAVFCLLNMLISWFFWKKNSQRASLKDIIDCCRDHILSYASGNEFPLNYWWLHTQGMV